uniref:CUB domain-containing protein n=1 Tax=Parastrongyloides trichosuri TaxID=131310 RepID=A0A0N4ZQE2_PARTI
MFFKYLFYIIFILQCIVSIALGGPGSQFITVTGLAKVDEQEKKETYGLDSSNERIKEVKFNSAILKDVEIVKIPMKTFEGTKGVKVSFTGQDNKFITVYKTDLTGTKRCVSKKTNEVELICSVASCDFGIVFIGDIEITTEKCTNPSANDYNIKFFLEYIHDSVYIAENVKTSIEFPSIYECPGLGWIDDNSERIFKIDPAFKQISGDDRPKSIYIGNENFDSSENEIDMWQNIRKNYHLAMMVEYEKDKHIVKCGSIIKKVGGQSTFTWGYKLIYTDQTEIQRYERDFKNMADSVIDFRCSQELQDSIGSTSGTKEYLYVFKENEATKYGENVFDTYLSTKLEKLYYGAKYFIFDLKGKFKKDRHNSNNYVEKDSIFPKCEITIINIDNQNVQATIELDKKFIKDFTTHKINGRDYSVIYVKANDFNKESKSITKVIQCIANEQIDPTLSSVQKKLLSRYYSDIFKEVKYIRIEHIVTGDNSIGNAILPGALVIKDDDYSKYGSYKCFLNQKQKNSNVVSEGRVDKFLLIPQNGETFLKTVKVASDGTIDKHCYIKFKKFAKLIKMTIEFSGTSNKGITDGPNFEGPYFTKTPDEKQLYYKQKPEYESKITCKYETEYGTTFYIVLNYNEKEVLGLVDKVLKFLKDNPLWFCLAAVFLMILLIGSTVGGFMLIRKRRRRRRAAASRFGSSNMSKTRSKFGFRPSNNKSISAKSSKTGMSRTKSPSGKGITANKTQSSRSKNINNSNKSKFSSYQGSKVSGVSSQK